MLEIRKTNLIKSPLLQLVQLIIQFTLLGLQLRINNNTDNNTASRTSPLPTTTSTLSTIANDQQLTQKDLPMITKNSSVPLPLQTTQEVIETTSTKIDPLQHVDNPKSNANPNYDSDFLPTTEDSPVSIDTQSATSQVNNNY